MRRGKRVSPTYLVHLERNRYSVPASFANRPVSLRVYPHRVVVAAEGQIVCEHRRVIDRSHDRPDQTIYDWRHYLAVVQRKPGALRNGAPFAELPDAFRALQQYLLKKPGGDREMVDILALVLQHDEQAVLSAVFSTVELVNALEQEKAQGRSGQIANRLVHSDLVILDELGYLPFSPSGGAMLFHLLSKLYKRISVVITTNLSFSEWASVFGDADDYGAAGPAHAPLPHPWKPETTASASRTALRTSPKRLSRKRGT